MLPKINTIAWLGVVIGVLSIIVFGYYAYMIRPANRIIGCTAEAKICPDGSSVGRTGPNCEFAACPGTGNLNEAVYCAQDVQTCPDGSVVTRQAPSCAFAACPPSNLPTYSVAEVVADPTRFADQTACVRGWYQSSFEFTAFAATTETDANGNTNPREPFINVYDAPGETGLTCRDAERATSICGGVITLCGRLRYAPAGQSGYGASNTMRWQLEPTNLAPDR